MKWDIDSPFKFNAVATIHNLDQRFQMEDEGYFNFGKFRWDALKNAQMNIDQFLKVDS